MINRPLSPREWVLRRAVNDFRLTHDAPGGIEEFQTLDRWSRASVGALEQRAVDLMFEIAQAATQRRLLDPERFCRLVEASMLRRGNRPP